MKNSAYVGIDIGATHSRLYIVDNDKKIIVSDRCLTQTILKPTLSQGLTALLLDEIETHSLCIKCIVLGLPATISKQRDRVLSTPNLNVSLEELNDVVPLLTEAFKCSVELERDVNLQMVYDIDSIGIAHGTVLGCYLGTGVGFSIWLNGELYTGAHGVAGELGHIPFSDNEKLCGCGNRGCLETVVSGIELKAEYQRQEASYQIGEFFVEEQNQEFIQEFVTSLARALAISIGKIRI